MSQTLKPQIDETTFHEHVTLMFFFKVDLRKGN